MFPKICTKCGGEVSRQAASCIHCGNPLRPESDDTKAVTLVAASSPVGVGVVQNELPSAVQSPNFSTGSSSSQPDSTAQVQYFEPPHVAKTIELSSVVATIFWRCLWVCAVVLLVVAYVVSRPVSSAPTLPAGVASMVNPDGTIVGANPKPSPPVPAPPSGSDITGYLASLQKTDLQRIGLDGSYTQALASATPSQPPSTTQNYGQTAQQALSDFQAQKPPPECSDLYNAYLTLLQDESSAIEKSMQQWQSSDPVKAGTIRDSAAPQIATDASAADTALGTLCATQHIDKPFSIVAGIVAGPVPIPAAPVTAPTTTSTTPGAPAAAPITAPPAGTAPLPSNANPPATTTPTNP